MSFLLDDIANWLTSQGIVGGSTGWNVYKGYMPPDDPANPNDQIISIFETPGEGPDIIREPSTEQVVDIPDFQIRGRGAVNGYAALRMQMQAVFEALHQNEPSPIVLYAFFTANLSSSLDGGVTWTSITTPNIFVGMVIQNNIFYATVFNGGIYSSSNFGKTWIATSAITRLWRSITSQNGVLYATVNLGGIYSSPDNGVTWTQTGAPSKGWFGITSQNGVLYAVVEASNDGIYYSPDNGVTWTQTTAPNNLWVGIVSQNGILYATVSGGGIYASPDNGVTWNQTSAPNRNWRGITSLNGILYVVVDGGGIYSSPDNGATWIQTGAPTENWAVIEGQGESKYIYIYAKISAPLPMGKDEQNRDELAWNFTTMRVR